MFRAISAIAGALSLSLLAASPVEAQSKSALRECKAKGSGGKLITWKCHPKQPCCFNPTLNKGVCGSSVIGCF